MGNPKRSGGGGEEPLHAAARTGDLKAVISICASNPLAVNSRDKHSRTPLHLAAWSGQTEVVNYLCKNKADVGAAAMDDMGAIHFAAQKGHVEVVRALLLSGVSIKTINRKGLTPLHYAAQGSHLDLVQYLVRKGASLTTMTKAGKTPLDLATKVEVVSFLKGCQDSSKQGENQTSKGNVEKCDSKPSMEDKATGSSDETVIKRKEEGEKDSEDENLRSSGEDQDHVEEKLKRKGEGDKDEMEGNSSKPKKARVALNHLLFADYTQEEN
ncbi:Ankyrin-1 [Thalictrum thalictroides]|uniref:Ankyrin-1 n=1 Tax=Thalictrum thalictroides TaxID=46969 RepID=A0A7J6WLQ5_THATH|nr:Ankyrin-1 [Thalictrum thalictroides]